MGGGSSKSSYKMINGYVMLLFISFFHIVLMKLIICLKFFTNFFIYYYYYYYYYYSTGNPSLKLDWVANSSNKGINPMKAESFNPISPLGKGKFGHVFLCQHSNSGKHVAIKFISKEIVSECQSATRLQQEFNALNKIYHPFIVHTFGFYEVIYTLL
jgi:serine/threonine protein kinase